MSAEAAVGERYALTMRTSWLSEYRTPEGALVMFDIGGHYITFGMLCSALAQFPSVEFADFRVPARFAGPARFRFKGHDYQIEIAHLDNRILAADPGAAHATTDELLARVRDRLTRKRHVSEVQHVY